MFSSGTYRVTEGDALEPELVLSHARSDAVTVRVEALDLGEAESGVDFVADPWHVTIPVGQTRHSFSIATVDDTKIERTEQFLLHIAPYGHSPGLQRSSDGNADAVVYIADSVVDINDDINGDTTISLPASEYTLWEGGTAKIKVAIKNPKPTAFTLDYTLSGDTASGADVVGGFGTRSITVPANAREVYIPIGTVQDTIEGEYTETFSVRLSTSEPGIAFGSRIANVSINDDDTDAGVTFASASSSANEGAGTHNVTMEMWPAQTNDIIVMLYHIDTDCEVVRLALRLAIAGSDYEILPRKLVSYWSDICKRLYKGSESPITIPAGETTVAIPVTIIDDSDYEGNELVRLLIVGIVNWQDFEGPPNKYWLTNNPSARRHKSHKLTIVDDETPTVEDKTPTASFASASQTVQEGSGTSNVTVNLSPAPAADITLAYTVEGTATSGSDYTALSGTLAVPKDATTATIPVALIDDSANEGAETVVLTLSAGTGYKVGSSDTHTLTIAASDPPAASFASASQTAQEGSGTSNVTVNLSPAPADDITLSYTVDGTATSGSDYTALSGTVAVSAGATTATVPVAIIDDSLKEDSETVVLTLSAGSGYEVGSPDTHTLTIAASDGPPQVSFEPIEGRPAGNRPTWWVKEGSGTHNVKVKLNPPPTSDITVRYKLGGQAVSGSDYTALSGTLSVPKGATTATIPVTIIDDDEREFAEEIVLFLLGGTGYEVGRPDRHTLIIDPSDGLPWISLVPVQQSAGEGSGTQEVGVRLGPAPATDIAFAYRVTGTATSGSDYEALSGSVTVSRGTTTAKIPVTLIDDSLKEGSETVILDLTGSAGYKVTSPGTHTLTIVDDETPASLEPQVTIVAGSSPVTEGSDATFTVTANPAPAAELSVTVTVATAGEFGVTAGTQTVTIPTTGSATLTLATSDDEADEPDGSVSVTVAAGDGYTVGSPASGTVAIADDDPAPAVATVDAALVAQVTALADGHSNPEAAARLRRIVKGMTGEDGGYTAEECREAATRHGVLSTWKPWCDEIARREAQAPPEPQQQQVVTLPAVTVSAGADVTEGGDAVFTVTANPAPAAGLAVTVTVATAGEFGVTAGSQPVTIPTTGSATLTLTTAGDDTDEPDGSVSVTVAAGDGYTVGDPASGTVAIADDDLAPPLPAITVSAGDAVTEGGDATFTVTASPAPASPLAVSVTVAAKGDYGIASGTQTVSIPTTGSATLTLATANDDADEPDGSVTLTVAAGDGYTVGDPASGTVSIADDDLPPPAVSIAATAASVTEGGAAAFTLTADRAPDADLTVTLSVAETGGGDHVAVADEGPATAVIAKGATEAVFSVATVDDDANEPDGSVTVTLKDGGGYTVPSPPGNAAAVTVSDNDAAALPSLSVADVTVKEGAWMEFTVRLSAPSAGGVSVKVSTRDSTPVSATTRDYWPISGRTVSFRAGETERSVGVIVFDDSHDEEPETFEFVLSGARGAAIGDGVAVGTIMNDDPMPAAWLARFGRAVAEQALDGIAARMVADRTPGMQGSIAGQALSFDPAANDNPGSRGAGPGLRAGGAGAAPAHAPDGIAVPGGTGALALADVAQAFGGQSGHSGPGGLGHDAAGFANGTQSRTMTARDALLGSSFSLTGATDGSGGFGHDAAGFGSGFDGMQPQSRGMTARDALLGSSFSLTGATDGSGGSMAFWGRAAQGGFDGREGTFSLDGTVTTGMLGADYARGKWLVGLALAQSEGEGDYRDSDVSPRADGQSCPDGVDSGLCSGAVRAGDGKVEASLTAAIPYAALQASERLKLWGAAGHGTGEVTLKTALGGSYSSDTTWSVAAAGLRGALLAPPAPGSGSGGGSGSGPALAVTSDALWTRSSSEKTNQLAASESDATRLRLGLEGSYRMALEGGGHVTPKLEVGARHDGGDAETGFGVEIGGGIAWSDPALGLSLDISGRTLIAHGNDDLKDRGYAASLAFDRDPATRRGPSLSLRQEFGGRAQGGLDALFAPDPLEDRTGSEASSRWALDAAYGFPAFGGRWTGSPHAGLGFATGARDYSVGWRLTPASNANAPDISLGLRATRRESDTALAEHTVGFEITARW